MNLHEIGDYDTFAAMADYLAEQKELDELIREYEFWNGKESEETEVKEVKNLKEVKETIESEIIRYERYPDDDGAGHRIIALTYVLGLLNQLDEPEVLSQKWIDENGGIVFFPHGEGIDFGHFVKAEDLQNLLVPKQEEIGVPEWFAEWFEGRGYEMSLYGIFNDLYTNNKSKMEEWSKQYEMGHTELQNDIASIKLYGKGIYEMEKEPKYFAKIKGHENISSDDKYWNYCITDKSLDIGDNKVHADVLAEYVLSATKDEWANLGISDDNADFVEVEELEE